MHFLELFGLSLLAAGQVSCAAVPAISVSASPVQSASASPVQSGVPSVSVSAIPRSELVERAATLPVECGPASDRKAYGSEEVKRAYTKGKALWKAYDDSRKWGKTYYPKHYGALGGNVASKLPKECPTNTGELVEWPLMEDGSIWPGGVNPGKDRVVMFDQNKDGKTVIFCGVMTHRGAGENFNWCDPSTS